MDKYVVLTILLKLLVTTMIAAHYVQSASLPSESSLMGGHLDNNSHIRTEENLYDMYSEYEDSREVVSANKNITKTKATDSEEIPDPSPLVVPGYNLPENIFNSGRPFYVEKDPLTGKIDFSHKSPEVRSEDQLYDYIDDQPSDNLHDKANINRKDGSISSHSHKHTDVNQLTPNFHDFLNLPVKYNPEKYVYPLISSSYASTKIQGSVNKFHNHKDYNSYKTTTKKPTVSPTYYTTHSSYFNPRTTQRTIRTTSVTTTTTTTPKPVTKRYPEIYLTTPLNNILNTGMSHPSFGEEYDYYDSQTETPTTTTKSNIQQVYTTTKKSNIGDIYLTTGSTTNKPITTTTTAPSTSTKSWFDQLFGDYEESATTTTERIANKPTGIFANLPNKFNKPDSTSPTSSTSTVTTKATVKIPVSSNTNYPNIHAGPDKIVSDGTSMGLDTNYDYNDDYNEKVEDNLAVENKYSVNKEDSLSVEPLKPEINTVFSVKPQSEKPKPNKPSVSFVTTEDSYLVQKISTEDNRVKETTTASTTTTTRTTTTTTSTTTKTPTITSNNPPQVSTPKVTSLPLGENHINVPINRDPIIVATQNLREKLNSEKVAQDDYEDELQMSLNKKQPQIFQPQNPPGPVPQLPQRPIQTTVVHTGNQIAPVQSSIHVGNGGPAQGGSQTGNQHAPSSSNIHVPAGQDTVSFVMGHHQNVDGGPGVGGQYVGTSLNESPYDHNPFRPLFGQQATHSNSQDSNSYNQKQPSQKEQTKYTQNRPISEIQNYQTRPHGPPPKRPMFVQQNRPLNYSPQNRPNQHIDPSGSAVTIQPQKQSEASLAIGLPISGNKPVPGKVVDDKPYKNDGKFEFPKETRVKFPQDKIGQVQPQGNYPPQQQNNIYPPQQTLNPQQNNREVLKLSSKPMYHQLPSDLTPPKENEVGSNQQPQRYDRPVRPPWDPRPGHFYTGKPEYARPPRPLPQQQQVAYKRIDNLPNILPQFRPNVKQHYPPYHFEQRINRPQPLFERPSNRPIGFFEKMMPPPLPPQPFRGNKNPSLRNSIPQIDERTPLKTDLQSLDDNETPMAEDRIMTIDQEVGDQNNNMEDVKIQELSMYQTPPNIKIPNRRVGEDISGVETLQMIQAKHDKENEIKNQEEELQSPIDIDKPIQVGPDTPLKESTDKTIYKVYPVNTAPLKLDAIDSKEKEGVVVGTRAEMPLPPSKIENDFSYTTKDRNNEPILKPHPKPQIPVKSDFPYPLERPVQPANNVEDSQQNSGFLGSNQWEDEKFEPKIIHGNKINYNQISATLKTYTEKPIAVAYTPTESQYDSYSLPVFGRPGVVESEIYRDRYLPDYKKFGHRVDTDIEVPAPERSGFQTPFQPSLQLDPANQGWTAVRDKNKTTPILETETTTMPLATTREFDIENFKPQLEGGFKPMYTIPEERVSEHITEVLEPREE